MYWGLEGGSVEDTRVAHPHVSLLRGKQGEEEDNRVVEASRIFECRIGHTSP